MKRQVSNQYTQLTLDFEFEATLPTPVPSKEVNYFTQEDFEEWMAIEQDIMYGRGASLYKQIERDLAVQRKQAQMIHQFEAIRASIYQ